MFSPFPGGPGETTVPDIFLLRRVPLPVRCEPLIHRRQERIVFRIAHHLVRIVFGVFDRDVDDLAVLQLEALALEFVQNGLADAVACELVAAEQLLCGEIRLLRGQLSVEAVGVLLVLGGQLVKLLLKLLGLVIRLELCEILVAGGKLLGKLIKLCLIGCDIGSGDEFLFNDLGDLLGLVCGKLNSELLEMNL